jgi:3beta-hydroxysteroid-4beta-carboxylate 3-dehydrogenase (decarboxylating)
MAAMILVTGAGGHLGANLVRRLSESGQSIRAALFRARESPALQGLDLDVFIGDLSKPDIASAAVKGCNFIYHCAGRVSMDDANSAAIYRANTLVTREVLRAALRHHTERIVVASSLSTVGLRADGPSNEDDPFDPLEHHLPYAYAKVAVEHECLKAFADGLPVVIANPSGIIGPYDFGPSLLGQILIRFAERRLYASTVGGFACVAARDVAQGFVLAMEKGRPGQRYILDSGYLSFDELMDIFSQVTGQPKPRLRISPALLSPIATINDVVARVLGSKAKRTFTVGAIQFIRQQQRVDISKAERELGFKPTSLTAAVREAYEWFVSQGVIKTQRIQRD